MKKEIIDLSNVDKQDVELSTMSIGEINNLLSLVGDTAFRLGAGIETGEQYLEYIIDQIPDKDIREHVRNVLSSIKTII